MRFQPSLIPRFNLDYSFSDLLYAFKSNFEQKNVRMEPLRRIFGNKTFFFTNNGRSSLYIILRALNLPKGSKIGIPLYTCTVVFDAIIKAGHVPCFIDLDLDNYTISLQDLEKKIHGLSAVIVTHTFGRPADIDEIKKITKDIPIIEDCAHSLLSEYKNKKTGTLGFASFFSLSKYISIGDGGMIILNNDDFKEAFENEIFFLNAPNRLNAIKHALFTYIYSFLYHIPWYGVFAYSIGSYLDEKIDISDKKSFNICGIRKSNLNLFLKKLKEFDKKVCSQRKNSYLQINELNNSSLKLPYEAKDTWCNFYLFPILFDTKVKREAACDYLLKRGIDTSKLFSKVPTLARKYYGYKGDCPNSERFADNILVIPNYYSLNDKELLKIIAAIKNLEAIA